MDRLRHWLFKRSTLLTIGLGAAIVLAIGVLGPWRQPHFQGNCVPANRVDELGPRIYDNHRTITVSPGTVVTVQLWTGAGLDYWPWEAPKSNDEAVLQPIPLCLDPPNITTVPLQLTPFKAIAPGRATLTAGLSRDDPRFEAFSLTVVVRR
jgi:hypothetical protein